MRKEYDGGRRVFMYWYSSTSGAMECFRCPCGQASIGWWMKDADRIVAPQRDRCEVCLTIDLMDAMVNG